MTAYEIENYVEGFLGEFRTELDDLINYVSYELERNDFYVEDDATNYSIYTSMEDESGDIEEFNIQIEKLAGNTYVVNNVVRLA